jgi:hypothetical protein
VRWKLRVESVTTSRNRAMFWVIVLVFDAGNDDEAEAEVRSRSICWRRVFACGMEGDDAGMERESVNDGCLIKSSTRAQQSSERANSSTECAQSSSCVDGDDTR